MDPCRVRIVYTVTLRHDLWVFTCGWDIPEWPIVVGPINDGPNPGELAFRKRQETTRKEIKVVSA